MHQFPLQFHKFLKQITIEHLEGMSREKGDIINSGPISIIKYQGKEIAKLEFPIDVVDGINNLNFFHNFHQ